MSRLAKKPIVIPEKVTVSQTGADFSVTGPLGQVSRTISPEVLVTEDGKEITIQARDPGSRAGRIMIGTTASHLKNMIAGVTTGFKKELLIEGVGYKVSLSGNTLTFNLGFSHPVLVPIPATLKVTVDKGSLSVAGVSKEVVGQFSASLRALKPPEPYKGKGIRYSDEVIRRKQGKKVVS